MHPLRSRTTYTEALGDEVCVYEWARHEVHALNPTAACVWQLCDGKTSVGEMAERLRDGQLPFAEQLVELALDVFKNKHLLDADRTAPAASPPMSRRALVKRGLTAALLPVVASVIAPTPLQAQSPGARLQTFDFTGTSQTFIVPPGFTSVTVSAFGAEGGSGNFFGQPVGPPGGLGGSITATLAVTPGETLVVVVGGIPLPVGIAHGPGFNGGGRSGSSISKFAGPGGGASDVRRGGSALGNRVVVAGGGGGGGTGSAAAGGAGGGTMGGDGGGSLSGAAGTGGTQTAGGIGGVSPPFPFSGGQAGVSGIGGDGGSFVVPGGGGSLGSAGGGGGGGYYGGGGGAAAAGAGGGSSFAHPSATGVVHVQGTRAGAGLIVLSW